MRYLTDCRISGLEIKSYDDKVSLGRKLANDFVNYMHHDGYAVDTCLESFFRLLKLFVSADKDCTRAEYDFFIETTKVKDVDTDLFYRGTNGGSDPEFVLGMERFLSTLSTRTKEAALDYGVLLCSAARKLTKEERELFGRMYEVKKFR